MHVRVCVQNTPKKVRETPQRSLYRNIILKHTRIPLSLYHTVFTLLQSSALFFKLLHLEHTLGVHTILYILYIPVAKHFWCKAQSTDESDWAISSINPYLHAFFSNQFLEIPWNLDVLWAPFYGVSLLPPSQATKPPVTGHIQTLRWPLSTHAPWLDSLLFSRIPLGGSENTPSWWRGYFLRDPWSSIRGSKWCPPTTTCVAGPLCCEGSRCDHFRWDIFPSIQCTE